VYSLDAKDPFWVQAVDLMAGNATDPLLSKSNKNYESRRACSPTKVWCTPMHNISLYVL